MEHLKASSYVEHELSHIAKCTYLIYFPTEGWKETISTREGVSGRLVEVYKQSEEAAVQKGTWGLAQRKKVGLGSMGTEREETAKTRRKMSSLLALGARHH